ncbi:MAG: hemolysin III family protein [Actinomyces graevenitzii]|jgi:hly-III family protein|uniref:Hemolysin III family protein n=1 Tax=Actinomyces graevenitzii TaxID=55565 RepID=A0A9E7AGB1_9ACTO|nr:MAG: hemolysin III family protein [Actinomyces graevenitzii]
MAAAKALSLSSDSLASAGEALKLIKPKLRGWIHAITAPLALAACIVLTVLAPTTTLKIGSAVYLACSLLLFANSGVYHISNGHFPVKVSQLLRRIDHANIYLLIAGTYTPLALALMTPDHQRLVLGIIWTGAVIGMVANVCWITAPRWLFTILYVVLGWVAVWFIPELYRAGGAAIVILIASGGVIYTLGAVVYALKKPDPLPRWFGFHEIFHACTVAAWVCQCIACYMAVLG